MPHSHTSIARTVLLLTAVALAVTACARIEPLETTGLREVFTGPRQDHWCREGDDARILENGADLIGPHFSVSFTCHFAERELPEFVVDGSGEPVRIPQLIGGAELLINQIGFEFTQGFEVQSAPVRSWIETGGERIDLASLPPQGGYLAIVVPMGEDAALWVEDEGRAQGMDFRTGARIEPVSTYYNGLGLHPVSTDPFDFERLMFLNGRNGWSVRCYFEGAELRRRVWLEDHGWAPDGSVYLSVQFNWCSGDYFEEIELSLNAERAVQIWGEEPEAFELLALDETPFAGEGGTAYSLVFEVPAELGELTFGFAPVGEVTEKDTGEVFQLQGLPEIVTSEVRF